METYIVEVAAGIGEVLLSPLAIAIALAIVLALATGVAGRLALVIEDHRFGEE